MNALRAVLVGCGGMSKTCLTAASKLPGLAMAGLVDLEPDRARRRAEEFGLSEAKPGHAVERVEVVLAPWEGANDGHQGLMREFVDCVRNGGQPMTHCEDNILSLAMVFGAIDSAEAGAKLPIRLDL